MMAEFQVRHTDSQASKRAVDIEENRKNWKMFESESHSVMSDSLRPHGPYSSWNFTNQNTGVGSLSFSRGSSQPRSPSSQADSLPAEPQGKSKNTGMGSLSLLQPIFPTQE